MKRSQSASASLLAVLVLLSGCSGAPDDASGQLVPVEALGVPPVESVDDMVFLGDFAVVFEVTGEHAREASSIVRDVSVEVRRVLWEGPRYSAPESFTFEDYGWTPDDAGPRREFVGAGGIRVRPGNEYAGVFVVRDTFDDPPMIGPLAPSTVFDLTGSESSRSIVLTGRPNVPPGLQPDRESGTMLLSELERVLTEARGHPELIEFDQEPNVVRLQILDDPDSNIRPGQVDTDRLTPLTVPLADSPAAPALGSAPPTTP